MHFIRFHPGLRRHFAFLGFELYGSRDRRGALRVMKRMAPPKQRLAKTRTNLWIGNNCHLPGRQFIKELNRKLAGHYNYFGIRSHEKALVSYFSRANACAFEWLNRRGGKGRSFN